MPTKILNYAMGHLPDDEIHAVLLTVDAEADITDPDGFGQFRVCVPATPSLNDIEFTIAEHTLNASNWTANHEIRFDRVTGVPKFGAPIFLEVTGFQSGGAAQPIWANTKATAVTIVLSRNIGVEAADPMDIYQRSPDIMDRSVNPESWGRDPQQGKWGR